MVTSYRPLFMSGIARGGTNLAVMIANAHPQVAAVHDPFLAIFKSYRNAAVRASLAGPFDEQSPLDEYYYFDQKLAVMRAVHECGFDLPFDPGERERLIQALTPRTQLSSPILVPLLNDLAGRSYTELVASGLKAIRRARQAGDVSWVGFNENWAVEFFLPLARAFPAAKFVAIVRDIRAAVASHRKTVEAKHRNPLFAYPKDRSMLALTLSFVRCWRKHVAMIAHFSRQPEMAGRLLVLRYEDLARTPEREVRRLCAFLELPYADAMLDPGNFIAGDNRQWISNSSYESPPATGIYASTLDRWRETLDDELAELVEFVAGPDLATCGYPPAREFDGIPPWAAYRRHSEEHRTWLGGGLGWRTDNRNPDVDFALELLRRSCLRPVTEDSGLIERCFLFREAYEGLLSGTQLPG